MSVPGRLLSDWFRAIGARILIVWVCAVVVFQCIDVFENLRDYTAGGASTRQILAHFVLRTPEVAFQILPAAVLLGALIGLYYLAKNRELTAAEAAGLHPGWIYGVPASIGAGLVLLQLGLELGPMPDLRSAADRFYTTKIERNPLRLDDRVRWTVIGEDLWRLEMDGHDTFRVERYRRSQGGLSVVRIADLQATADGWQYGNASLVEFPGDLQPQLVTAVNIPFLPEELRPARAQSRHESLLDLFDKARKKRSLTGQVSPMLLEFHQRLSWALMSLTVLLAILPFVPRHGRQASTASGVVVALVIGLVGWATIVMGTALATSEKNVLGFWLPHFFLLLTGLVGSTRIKATLLRKMV